MFFVGARKPLFSRIYNLRHDGLPSYDLMVVSVSGNFCEIESVWQKITLCEYLSQTPADEKRAQLSFYDQFFESFVSSTKWGGLWWVRTLFIVATHILNVKMPTLGYLFEFGLSTLPEAVPEVICTNEADLVAADFLMIQGHFEVKCLWVIKSGEPCDCHSMSHKLYKNVWQNLRSFLTGGIPSLVVWNDLLQKPFFWEP